MQDIRRSQQLHQLASQTGASGVWFRTMRRVQGSVRYADTVCVGSDPGLRPLATRDGQPVAQDYAHMTVEQVLPWNRWVEHAHGDRVHARRMLVTPEGHLIGLIDLLPAPDQLIDALIEQAQTWDNQSPFDAAPPETAARECALWCQPGRDVRSCPAGRLLWRNRAAQAAITTLIARPEPVASAFLGSLWLERTRTPFGSIVWALPSTPVVPSPLGSLTEAARRVALELMQGTSVPQAAANLRRSKETVRTHSQQIRRRLAVSSRLEMADRLNQVHWR